MSISRAISHLYHSHYNKLSVCFSSFRRLYITQAFHSLYTQNYVGQVAHSV